MRILFMGTPDFAAVSLKRLVEDGHEICGVFTQPDKPRNRNKVTFSPVKEYALSHGLTVYQPTKLRDGTALELVRSLAPELIVVVAYGRILPKDILDAPPLGCVNVHASLLPKYRGPFGLYVIFSVSAIPIPCRIPPSACTLARLMLTGVPQSTQASNSMTFTSPVSVSVSSSTAPTINGGGEVGE